MQVARKGRQQNGLAHRMDRRTAKALADPIQNQGFETAGETYVTGAWEGADAAYSGPAVEVPEAFGETVYRKAELFEDLVALLREPAQPLGISEHDFRNWLPRALTVLQRPMRSVGMLQALPEDSFGLAGGLQGPGG